MKINAWKNISTSIESLADIYVFSYNSYFINYRNHKNFSQILSFYNWISIGEKLILFSQILEINFT